MLSLIAITAVTVPLAGTASAATAVVAYSPTASFETDTLAFGADPVISVMSVSPSSLDEPLPSGVTARVRFSPNRAIEPGQIRLAVCERGPSDVCGEPLPARIDGDDILIDVPMDFTETGHGSTRLALGVLPDPRERETPVELGLRGEVVAEDGTLLGADQRDVVVSVEPLTVGVDIPDPVRRERPTEVRLTVDNPGVTPVTELTPVLSAEVFDLPDPPDARIGDVTLVVNGAEVQAGQADGALAFALPAVSVDGTAETSVGATLTVHDTFPGDVLEVGGTLRDRERESLVDGTFTTIKIVNAQAEPTAGPTRTPPPTGSTAPEPPVPGTPGPGEQDQNVGSPGDLPNTGASVGPLVGVGVVFLLAGAGSLTVLWLRKLRSA